MEESHQGSQNDDPSERLLYHPNFLQILLNTRSRDKLKCTIVILDFSVPLSVATPEAKRALSEI